MGELKPISRELSKKIADRIKKKLSGKTGFSYPINVSADFIFSIPVGYLNGIAGMGYGSSAAARIEDLVIPGLFAGAEFQVI
jgi:hypothetical protein